MRARLFERRCYCSSCREEREKRKGGGEVEGVEGNARDVHLPTYLRIDRLSRGLLVCLHGVVIEIRRMGR